VALAGIEHAHVGMYLTGDREASDLAEALCHIQEADGGALSKEMAREATRMVESMHAATAPHSPLAGYDQWVHGLFTLGRGAGEGDASLKDAQAKIAQIQDRLGLLSGVEQIAELK
jgi:hypothetical protein